MPLNVAVCFLNFLRGMETPGAGAEARRPACFLNFLRGMETRQDGEGADGHGVAFLNFLRGMETSYM